ncbi:hypothetical protein LIER_14823 [Lithospermum erythrorhizon]|uniref:Dicer-like protein 4 n=1 Tax=Lithospermum erythrorhizon TaxID=34254 RepID=A0AAV3Q222_LITER
MDSADVSNGHNQDSVEKCGKNPWDFARKYQMDLCRKALEENVIVYLGTGCGKTHIAILLIYEMGRLIKKPQKNICIFLAPTVALVQQQAKVIADAIDFEVGIYCGSSHLKGRHDWEKEMDQYEIFVMTPQILVHNLSHCFMRMELISLLIFDECHYAQVESNHPYAEIMKVFYKADAPNLPRIFGMTASPKLGKGGSIDSLESLLHAKVYSVEENDEFEQFVSSPKVNIYYYGPETSDPSSSSYLKKLEVLKDQCVSELYSKNYDHKTTRSSKKALVRLHGNIVFCLESLGVWGALQACRILLKGDQFEQDELVVVAQDSCDESSTEKYLMEAASVFAADYIKDDFKSEMSRVEVLTKPFFSRKILRLIGLLSNFGLQPNMKCIVFVNRIITARSLTFILRNLNFLSSWKCDFLVGLHSGLKTMSLKKTNSILEKFRSGELNLLVATKVGEEGLDIQTCCLVIRFDLPDTVASFIQSRGRARMPQSEYAFLVDRGNQSEINLIERFNRDEERMNAEVASREARAVVTEFAERTYKVEKTGATISMVASVSLLHRYCSKLPRDEYFIPKPQFFYFDDVDGMICNIILPSNAPIHRLASCPQPSIEEAKRDACLKACKALHEVGALTDFLLPEQKADEESSEEFSDSECSDDEDSRRELHEMHIPNTLRKAWIADLDSFICIHCYYIKFCPNPPDRLYEQFGLFIKETLPREAENLKLVLNLARGRSVKIELIPSGIVTFAKEEMIRAEKFQTLTLKIILDRSQLNLDFISLESSDGDHLPPTFYLFLPVLLDNDKVSVNWKLIERCLSSPVFQSQKGTGDRGTILLGDSVQLANGRRNINDVVDSLIYVPCKGIFFFVSDVVTERNSYSSFKGEKKTHAEHYMKKFKIHLLHPNQPLLRVKQLFVLDNLLTKKGYSEVRDKEEHFVEVPPEICQLKVVGFSKAIGSSFSLLPSFMHRLESLLVAIDLKAKLSSSIPEGNEITATRILEALTTEICHEGFSLERLEVLGDAFLKFAVGRHLFLSHDSLDEGQLTTKRSNIVNNSNLHKLALRNNLQVYIQDQMFDPYTYYVWGRPCPVICDKKTEKDIHSTQESLDDANIEIRCSKNHHWLHKKTIADVVEALVGAFIVDSGFKAAIAFLKWIGINVVIELTQLSKICLGSKEFLPLANHTDLSAVESAVRYHFVHKGLLIQAFVHPSYNSHVGGCYQRLEFLGDAVLDYLITSYLYSAYPNLKPGQLTDLRSALVNNNSFADIAVRLSFYKHIICDCRALSDAINKYVCFVEPSGSETNLDEKPHCPKALGDLVESCMGAILLDSGFDLNYVWNIMLSLLDPVMSFSKLPPNPLRELQELCQSLDRLLEFSSEKKGRSFTVEATVNVKGAPLVACATGRSIKAAKRTISQEILSQLKAQGYKSKSISLEEVLRKSSKMQPRLIGHDEKCHQISAKSHDLNMRRTAKDGCNLEGHSRNGYTDSSPEKTSSSRRGTLNFQPIKKTNSNGGSIDSRDRVSSNGFHSRPRVTGTLRNISAKSRLYELCAGNSWKPPRFECCEEIGPSHLKEFSFKVVVEIEEAVDTIVECYGQLKLKKKEAAETAAMAALWFLRHEGYMWNEM